MAGQFVVVLEHTGGRYKDQDLEAGAELLMTQGARSAAAESLTALNAYPEAVDVNRAPVIKVATDDATAMAALRPNFHCHLLNTGEKQVGSFMRFDLAGHTMHGPAPAPSDGMERSCCLIHASIAVTKMAKADSARRCRFRKSQQKRASDLDSIDG
jgi:hypothetical protein